MSQPETAERKHYSDEQISTIKALDEMGMFGVLSITDEAEKKFKEMVFKNADMITKAFNEFNMAMNIPRVVMRKPWQDNAAGWTAEALLEIVNKQVDESEGMQKITLDECRQLVELFTSIGKKIGPLT